MAASSPTTGADASARVAALVGQHGTTLVRVARKYSFCADDAHDAFQRALEIYLRRLDTVEPATEVAWMRVVVRNEALAVRKSRAQLVSGEEPDLEARADDGQRSLQERVESSERVIRSAEALRHLKRDEAHALLLKAEGLSYGEIGEQLGWTYTKVNRCITEGRARFRRVFGGIESGEQCETFSPLLTALATGAAEASDLARLRPHLRHCGGCRAEVRRLHGTRMPVAALLPWPAFVDRLRPSSLKADLYALFGRLGGSEPVAAGLAAGGGGRSASATALIGLCLAGAGAGGYCAVGGPLPDAAALTGDRDRPRVERRAEAPPAAPSPGSASAPWGAGPAAPAAATGEERAQSVNASEPSAAESATAPEFGFEEDGSGGVGNRGPSASERRVDEGEFPAPSAAVAEAPATPPEPAPATAAPLPTVQSAPARDRAGGGGTSGEFGFER